MSWTWIRRQQIRWQRRRLSAVGERPQFGRRWGRSPRPVGPPDPVAGSPVVEEKAVGGRLEAVVRSAVGERSATHRSTRSGGRGSGKGLVAGSASRTPDPVVGGRQSGGGGCRGHRREVEEVAADAGC